MTRSEFIKNCKMSGYATPTQARRYCDNNPKESYDADDYIRVYRTTGYFASISRSGGGKTGGCK